MGIRDFASKAAKQEVRGGGDFFRAKGTGRCVVDSLEIFQGESGPKFAVRVVILKSSNEPMIEPGSTKVQICAIAHSDPKKRGPALADMKRTTCAVAGLNAETVDEATFVTAADKWINDKTDKANKPNLEATGALLDFESWEKPREGKDPLYLVRFTHVPQTDAERAEMREQLSKRSLDSEG